MGAGFPTDEARHHPDPLVNVLIAHQRHKPAECLCGPLPLGSSWAEHVAAEIRALPSTAAPADAPNARDEVSIGYGTARCRYCGRRIARYVMGLLCWHRKPTGEECEGRDTIGVDTEFHGQQTPAEQHAHPEGA